MTSTLSTIVPEIDVQAFIRLRQQIHAYPELGFDVGTTSTLVAQMLQSWGFTVHTGIGKSGVVGQLTAGDGQRRLGIRADMDALPILEKTKLPYASRRNGMMHACGHDGHTAMLLAAAQRLAQQRDFNGTLNVIFQPDEESLSGAKAMIEDGLFDRFPCDAIFALHNVPGLAAGKFKVLPGIINTSSDVADVTIMGVGGHGAMPQHTRDPMPAVAAIVMALQTIVARNVPPHERAVVSVGFIRGGETYNVIPEAVTLGLNVRAVNPEIRSLVERRIREVIQHTALAHGVEATVDYRQLTPPVVNSAAPTNLARDVCVELVGAENVETQSALALSGSEDFALMLLKVPGCYLMLGNGEGEFGGCSLHNAKYDFNDKVLPIGAACWVRIAQTFLI